MPLGRFSLKVAMSVWTGLDWTGLDKEWIAKIAKWRRKNWFFLLVTGDAWNITHDMWHITKFFANISLIFSCICATILPRWEIWCLPYVWVFKVHMKDPKDLVDFFCKVMSIWPAQYEIKVKYSNYLYSINPITIFDLKIVMLLQSLIINVVYVVRPGLSTELIDGNVWCSLQSL